MRTYRLNFSTVKGKSVKILVSKKAGDVARYVRLVVQSPRYAGLQLRYLGSELIDNS
jgi:hypothetical protein